MEIFGYPSFDSEGEKILTTYENEYSKMNMDIRVYKNKKGVVREFCSDFEETAILLISGKIKIKIEDEDITFSRKELFTDGPWCIHFPKNKLVFIEFLEASEVLVQKTENNKVFNYKVYSPEECNWKTVGENIYGNVAVRLVNTIFDKEIAPYSNMVLGEVINNRGNWSSYLPHSHPQPEVYYFKFDKEEGFGASFVGDKVFKSVDGSFSAIPGNNIHPQAVAPGFKMYTTWMIRHLDDNPWLQTDRVVDNRYIWLENYEFKDEKNGI